MFWISDTRLNYYGFEIKPTDLYGTINGVPYVIRDAHCAYKYTHNVDIHIDGGFKRGHVRVWYKTKYAKWRRRPVDESFFRHCTVEIGSTEVDLLDFLKSINRTEE